MNPVSPTRVIGGRYVVLAELGRGGMGIVWRAEDRVMGRHVAVKELHLPAGLGPDERRQFRDRLLREARTAGRLNDPGIVTVYDVVTDEGVDHIVMELIEAQTLADVVDANGPLDERSVVSLARQLLDALRVAHDNGVVHRDVKPSNVMLVPGGRVKLTDFGIAQAADDPRLTTTGSVVGSPSYLAPERLEGNPATPATDLWALGVTLYYAVQGISPFSRDTTAATLAAVLHGELPSVPHRGPLGAVIAGLLQRDTRVRLSAPQATALLSGAQSTAAQPANAQLPGGRNPGAQNTGMQSLYGASDATTRLGGNTAQVSVRRWPWRWLAAVLVVGLVLGAVGGYVFSRSGGPPATIMTYAGAAPSFSVSTSPSVNSTCSDAPIVDSAVFPTGQIEDCEKPHTIEFFGTLDLYGDAFPVTYPGREKLGAAMAQQCRLLFASENILGDDKDSLEVVAMIPAQRTFESAGSNASRATACVMRTKDGGPMTGSRIRKIPD